MAVSPYQRRAGMPVQRNVLVVRSGQEEAQAYTEAIIEAYDLTTTDDGFTLEVDLGPEWSLVRSHAEREDQWRSRFLARYESAPVDYQAFLDEIIVIEDDRRWFACRVLADRLQEAGLIHLAYCWRWMAESRCFPVRMTYDPQQLGPWTWADLTDVPMGELSFHEIAGVPNLPPFFAYHLIGTGRNYASNLGDAVQRLSESLQEMRFAMSVKGQPFPPIQWPD